MPETGHVAPKSAPGPELASGRRKRWAPDPAETIACTTSRRSQPRAWLRALERAVEAGLLPGFNDTTRRIIEVLASRMGFDTGHCRYVMRDVMERTGLGKTAVTDHLKMLRAGGWIAWVEHGSLRNALRNLGKPGYAKTATVYAATIPPAYDRLMGHTLIGAGYEARIVIDRRPGSAVETAVDTAGIEAVENPDDETARTPSLWVDKEVGQVQMVGGKNGSTANAAASKIPRRKKKHTVTGYRITGERIDRARQLAVAVRPHVNWLQGASHDQLSWVFLDLVARDWSESRIVLWLRNLGQEIGVRRWRPRFPHRVIAAAIRRDDQAAAQRAITVGPDDEPYVRPVAPNAAFLAARGPLRAVAPRGPVEEMPTLDEVPENTWDLAMLREAAADDPAMILSFARHAGREATLRVYGTAAARILDAADEFTQAGFTVTA
ncbi:winged helix-turn-helix domain-containing protein [Streptomyces sp. NPDC127172]|uniref:winged helix-turn-helix domain-containing protein n=1 Tax=Streptomyces sp. NPDC127172 TaxID=3345382 RepID=UPI00363DB90E